MLKELKGEQSITYEYSLEVDAIRHAISIAEEGTFITALGDVGTMLLKQFSSMDSDSNASVKKQ